MGMCLFVPVLTAEETVLFMPTGDDSLSNEQAAVFPAHWIVSAQPALNT